MESGLSASHLVLGHDGHVVIDQPYDDVGHQVPEGVGGIPEIDAAPAELADERLHDPVLVRSGRVRRLVR
jgi:hypothetical protein